MQPFDFVTLSDAAGLAKVSRRTLYKHMHAGTAPEHWRIGREVVFRRADVAAWAAEYYPPGVPRKGRGRKPHAPGRLCPSI